MLPQCPSADRSLASGHAQPARSRNCDSVVKLGRGVLGGYRIGLSCPVRYPAADGEIKSSGLRLYCGGLYPDEILLIRSVDAVNLIRTIDHLPAEVTGGAVTIGNFDGVHRGHAALLERLRHHARAVGGPAVVFTFDPHPAELLYPGCEPPPLTWIERKAELLTELGADAIIACPTDRNVLSLEPRNFFQEIVCNRLRAQALVEGPNFFFGRHRAGSIDDLRKFCEASGIRLEVVEPAKVGGRYISSSWIRELILAGQIREAEVLLTQPYRVRGRVVQGAGRGRNLGFPTANIDPVGIVLPPSAVYAARGIINGTTYAAATHVGANPTFREDQIRIEVHLIDCHKELYGHLLELDFLKRLRDIRPFKTVEALQRQLATDVEATREITGL